MDTLCFRCTRLALRTSRISKHNGMIQAACSFSSSSNTSAENVKNNTSSTSVSTSERISKPRIRFTAGGDKSSQSDIKRPQQGQILRRRPVSPNAPVSSTSARTPQGQLLTRRTVAPRSSPGTRTAPGVQSTTRGGIQGQRRQDRRRRPAQSMSPDDDSEDIGLNEIIENYVNKVIDPHANPTESIVYKPKDMTLAELRADWPDTPLSSVGLTESVQQKIQWLARRLPHGYVTPQQLAERFHKGDFVRFESQEEKEKVLEIAAELANDRASELTQRKGEQVSPADMGFESLASRGNESKTLANTVVQGKYPEMEKQKLTFLDSVVRNLRNNETYGDSPSAKFMDKIESLIPPQALKGNKSNISAKRA